MCDLPIVCCLAVRELFWKDSQHVWCSEQREFVWSVDPPMILSVRNPDALSDEFRTSQMSPKQL